MNIYMDEALNVSIVSNGLDLMENSVTMIGGSGGVSIDSNFGGGGSFGGGGGDGMDDVGTSASGGGINGLLANWGFVGGITAGTLALSIIIGILLAKKRIKKGIDPYEN